MFLYQKLFLKRNFLGTIAMLIELVHQRTVSSRIKATVRITSRVSLFIFIILAGRSWATEKYTPDSDTHVIARWPADKASQTRGASIPAREASAQQDLTLAKNYLERAAQPGQSRLYGKAQLLLQPHIKKNTAPPEMWFAWAQLLQHQHKFSEALNALTYVLEKDPTHVSAQLMLARVYLVQDKPELAHKACLSLLGNSDLLTLSTCSLEVASHQGKLINSYTQLSALVTQQGLPDDQRAPWIIQVLADMAMRLKRPKEALAWLLPEPQEASVSYWAQWADIQLALQQPAAVLDTLAQRVIVAADYDDALLLRLALAESAVGGDLWQSRFRERVALREQRRDSEHANEIARYYLDIHPEAKAALYWARVNWDSAKEASDKQLLDRAIHFAEGEER